MKTQRWTPSTAALAPETLGANERVQFTAEGKPTDEFNLLSACYLAIQCIRAGVPCSMTRADGTDLLSFDGKAKTTSEQLEPVISLLDEYFASERRVGYLAALDWAENNLELYSGGQS